MIALQKWSWEKLQNKSSSKLCHASEARQASKVCVIQVCTKTDYLICGIGNQSFTEQCLSTKQFK